jgi:hypothetical protein
MNYIEQLLAKLEDVEARTQFSELATKAPMLNDWIIDPELRAKNDEITAWAETEWDYDHGMSKLEYQQSQELATLKSRGQGMEINELNDFLGKYIKDNGLMTKSEVEAQIKEKESAFNNELNLVSNLATRVSYLNAKYQKDYGDMFDPDEFVQKAIDGGYAKAGKAGLDQYYNEFTREKQTAKSAAELQKQIDDARADERTKVLAERGMGANGQMPTLDGSPEMGHFEAKLKGMAQTDPTATAAPANAELGRGTIARFAANAADAADRAGGRVN